MLGMVAALVTVLVATTVGAVSAYFGGAIDAVSPKEIQRDFPRPAPMLDTETVDLGELRVGDLPITQKPAQGSVTMDADASTTVANDKINIGLGYTSFVILTPTNAAAATLIAGASSPYVRTADHVDRTSFFINTADAGNAAGTETYNYEILQ